MSGDERPSAGQVEDALRDSARMRAIIDGLADAIVTVDAGGVMTSANAAATRMFGYSQHELVGRDFDSIIPESERSLKGATGEGRPVGRSRETEGRRKDGAVFPLELTVCEIRHDGERLSIGFIRDLSQRRGLEARLNRLHGDRLDTMADMAAALAHELNQPLAAASNYLSAARHMLGAKAEALDPRVDEALGKASSQLMRAGQIVSHIREFVARGEPSKLEHSLHDLIRRACEFIAPVAREADVELVLRLEAPEDLVLADRVQIEQALVNLCRNGIEAMTETPERTLTIATSVENRVIRTDVADTGTGLALLPNLDIFAPFTSTKSNGLGIGLSICRSIVESHHGTIWAEANPGGGAKFGFTLPLARFERGGD